MEDNWRWGAQGGQDQVNSEHVVVLPCLSTHQRYLYLLYLFQCRTVSRHKKSNYRVLEDCVFQNVDVQPIRDASSPVVPRVTLKNTHGSLDSSAAWVTQGPCSGINRSHAGDNSLPYRLRRSCVPSLHRGDALAVRGSPNC